MYQGGMKYQPIGDRILVRQDPAKEQSEGGLLLSQTHTEPPLTGKVEAIGSECKLGVKVKDHVIFAAHARAQLSEDEKDLLVMREEDVLAVMRT